MATSIPASPLRYPGGKQCLAPFVRFLIEENGLMGCTYAEPYAGGAGLALRLLMDGVVNQVLLNDKCPMVTTFWDTLFWNTDNLLTMVESEPVTMETWHKTREIINRYADYSPIEVAFSFFFQNRTNFSGVIAGGVIGGKAQGGKYKLDARYPKTRLIRLMEKVAGFRDKVGICNMDAILFMEEKVLPLGNQCLTYCDPPYFEKGQELYLNAYNPTDHADVAAFLRLHTNTMRWLVSYDNAPQIVELYKDSALYSFDLPYSAHRVRKGKELMALSGNVRLPSVAESLFEMVRL